MITDELLFRFLSQETTAGENRLINEWLSANTGNLQHFTELKSVYESTADPLTAEEISDGWTLLEPRLDNKTATLRLRPTLIIRISRVAAILLILIGSGLLFVFRTQTHTVRNDELITKSIFLPDGTGVDLGPGSKLVYSDEFVKGIREIRLSGDACFDVTSDPEHPFTVNAGLTKIKVTGTRFVVNAPPRGKEVEVSVKSGNVLFYNSEKLDKNSFRMGLVAGEKGIFYPAQNRMDKTKDPYFQTPQ